MNKRIQIIAADRLIVVDGEPLEFDFDINPEIHAIHWFGDWGEVEYVSDPQTGAKKPNVQFANFDAVMPFLTAYERTKAQREAEAKAQKEALENSAPWICEQINIERDYRMSLGVKYKGLTIQTRHLDDLANLQQLRQKAVEAKMGVVQWSSKTTWISEENTLLPLPTPDDAIAMVNYVFTVRERMTFLARELKDRVIAGERFDWQVDALWS